MATSELDQHYRARLQELRAFLPVDVIDTDHPAGWLCMAYWPGGPQPIIIEPPRDRRRSGKPAVSQ